jgi:hypothetical protein
MAAIRRLSAALMPTTSRRFVDILPTHGWHFILMMNSPTFLTTIGPFLVADQVVTATHLPSLAKPESSKRAPA